MFLPTYRQITPDMVLKTLEIEIEAMRANIRQLERDFGVFGNAKALKAWLRDQRERQEQEMEFFDMELPF